MTVQDAAAPRVRATTGRPPAAVVVLCLVQTMLVIDMTIVNVALPEMRRELGFTASGASWVVTAYALALGGLVLLSGRIGAVVGPRRALVAGVSVFVVASALGGFAPTAGALVAARVGQGLGAALAAPAVLVLLHHVTGPGRARAAAMSLFVVAIGVGGAGGLTLGGLLTAAFGWESVMLVNVPLGVLAVAGVLRLVPEGPRSRARFDVGGAVASTVMMTAAVYGLTSMAERGADPHTVGAFVAAGVAAVALVLVERRHAAPVVPLGLVTRAHSAAPLLAMLLVPAGQFGFLFFASQFAQDVRGWSPTATGLAIAPFAAALVLANLTTPRLVERFGERVTGSTGMVLLALGMLGMSRLDPGDTYVGGMLGPVLLSGLGAGLTIAPLITSALHHAPADQLPAASALTQAVQQLGGALGLAVLTTIAAGAAAGAGQAAGIGTALLAAVGFPLLALAVFATAGRRMSA